MSPFRYYGDIMVKEISKKFELLDHATGVRVKVFGSSPKELFMNALYAMASLQKQEAADTGTVGKLIGKIRGRKIGTEVFIESMDYDTLLVDFFK